MDYLLKFFFVFLIGTSFNLFCMQQRQEENESSFNLTRVCGLIVLSSTTGCGLVGCGLVSAVWGFWGGVIYGICKNSSGVDPVIIFEKNMPKLPTELLCGALKFNKELAKLQ